jgi:hypothetical protein
MMNRVFYHEQNGGESNPSFFAVGGRGSRLSLHPISINYDLKATVEIPYQAFSFIPRENGDFWFYSGYYQIAGDHRLLLQMGLVSSKVGFTSFDFY